MAGGERALTVPRLNISKGMQSSSVVDAVLGPELMMLLCDKLIQIFSHDPLGVSTVTHLPEAGAEAAQLPVAGASVDQLAALYHISR